MSETINIMFDENGLAKEYDDTFDITIHCESEEAHNKVLEILNRCWIPCSERLPEGFEPVLFTSKNGEIAIGYRDPRFKTYWACIDRADWHHTDFDVVAWMPLPEPYQEGEKNEHD